MTGPTLRRLLTLALTGWLAWGAAPQALADITNFQLQSIRGVSGLTLSDRFGLTVGEQEHLVNIEDCERYQGGRARFQARLLSTAPTAVLPAQYGVAYTSPGGTCTATNTAPVSEEDCFVVATDVDLTSTEIEFDVELSKLVGTDCDTEIEATSRVYIYLAVSGAATQEEVIDIEIDLDPPEAPEITSITPGDQRLNVDWSDEINESSEVTYTVYWSEAPFGEDDLGTVRSRSGLTATSFAIDDAGLENDVTYFVAVVAVDDADNRSPLSNLEEGTPVPTTDFWEHYQESGGQETGGFCFIATAAYGTPMAGQLQPLRRFRDSVLMTTGVGRAFVDTYYTWGRYAAAFIAERPVLRGAVRVALVPLVWFADLATRFGLPCVLLALALAALLFRRARQRAVRGAFGPAPLSLSEVAR